MEVLVLKKRPATMALRAKGEFKGQETAICFNEPQITIDP